MNKNLVRSFAKGYRYQDLVSTYLVSRYIFDSDLKEFVVDKKEENNEQNDCVDDIKIVFEDAKICFQIKYTSTSRTLSIDDLKDKGQLSLKKVIEYDLKQEVKCEYVFLLKWAFPVDDLSEMLIEAKESLRYGDLGDCYVFKKNKASKIKNIFSLKISNSDLENILNRIVFVVNTVTFSGEANSDCKLDTMLIERCKEIGAGKYPNEGLNAEQYAVCLFNALNHLRCSYECSANKKRMFELANINITGDMVIDNFSMEDNHYVSCSDVIDIIISKSLEKETLFCIGDPGSGKSYLIKELIERIKIQNHNAINYHLFTSIDDRNINLNKNKLLSFLIGNVENDFSIEQKTTAIDIDRLNDDLSIIDKDYFIIIDGLDHVYREYLDNENSDLVNTIFAIKGTEHAHIIIFSQKIDILSNEKFSKQIWYLPKWPKGKALKLAELLSVQFEGNDFNDIYEKSGGNPLYLTYLYNYYKNGESLIDLPIYSGNIAKYYDYLAKTLDMNYAVYFGAMTFYVNEDEFHKITNCLTSKANEIFRKINPILKNNCVDDHKFFHESFKRFLFDKIDLLDLNIDCINTNICNFLESLNFYEDKRAYNHYFEFLIKKHDYDKCLEFATYDFIYNSAYYFCSISSIKENLYLLMDSACKKKSLFSVYQVCLLYKMVDINFNEYFESLNNSDYFSVCCKLIGKKFYKTNIINSQVEKKVVGNINYVASINHLDFATIKYKPSFEDSYESNSNLKASIVKNHEFFIKRIDKETNIKLADLISITESFFDLSKIDELKNTQNRDIKKILNFLFLDQKYCDLNAFSFVFDSSPYKENYSKHLVDFSCYINNHLVDDLLYNQISRKAFSNYIYKIFLLIFDNKRAFYNFEQNNDSEQLENALISNLEKFLLNFSYVENIEPRPVDLINYNFTYLLSNLFLMPLLYIKGKLKTYLGVLDKLISNYFVTVRRSHFSAFNLEDALRLVRPYTTSNNFDELYSFFTRQISKRKDRESYYYYSNYHFALANLSLRFDATKAKYNFEEGVKYAICYGDHKDILLSDIINCFKQYVATTNRITDSDLNFILNSCYSVSKHTDGKETDYYFEEILDFLFEHDPKQALKIIISCQQENFDDYRIKNAFCKYLDSNFKNINIDLLFECVTFYEEYNFEIEIYLYLVETNKDDKTIISYFEKVLEKRRDEIQRDNELIKKCNEIITNCHLKLSKFEYADKIPFNYENKQNESEASVPGFLHQQYVDHYTLASIAECFLTFEINDYNTELLIKLVSCNRFSSKLDNALTRAIETTKDANRKFLLNNIKYLVLGDGWGKRFVNIESFKENYLINPEDTLQFIFDNLRFSEMPVYGFSGLADIERIVNKKELKEIWKYSKENIEKRLPNTLKIYKKDSSLQNIDDLDTLITIFLLSYVNIDPLKIYEVKDLFDIYILKNKNIFHKVKKYIDEHEYLQVYDLIK